MDLIKIIKGIVTFNMPASVELPHGFFAFRAKKLPDTKSSCWVQIQKAGNTCLLLKLHVGDLDQLPQEANFLSLLLAF